MVVLENKHHFSQHISWVKCQGHKFIITVKQVCSAWQNSSHCTYSQTLILCYSHGYSHTSTASKNYTHFCNISVIQNHHHSLIFLLPTYKTVYLMLTKTAVPSSYYLHLQALGGTTLEDLYETSLFFACTS